MDNVSNLTSHFQEILEGQVWVLPRNVHRTYLALRSNQDMAIWIGDNPPADTLKWFAFGGAYTVDIVKLDDGVLGPIHVVGTGVGGGDCRVISAVVEPTETVPI